MFRYLKKFDFRPSFSSGFSSAKPYLVTGLTVVLDNVKKVRDHFRYIAQVIAENSSILFTTSTAGYFCLGAFLGLMTYHANDGIKKNEIVRYIFNNFGSEYSCWYAFSEVHQGYILRCASNFLQQALDHVAFEIARKNVHFDLSKLISYTVFGGIIVTTTVISYRIKEALFKKQNQEYKEKYKDSTLPEIKALARHPNSFFSRLGSKGTEHGRVHPFLQLSSISVALAVALDNSFGAFLFIGFPLGIIFAIKDYYIESIVSKKEQNASRFLIKLLELSNWIHSIPEKGSDTRDLVIILQNRVIFPALSILMGGFLSHREVSPNHQLSETQLLGAFYSLQDMNSGLRSCIAAGLGLFGVLSVYSDLYKQHYHDLAEELRKEIFRLTPDEQEEKRSVEYRMKS